jgi:hypothetical protein
VGRGSPTSSTALSAGEGATLPLALPLTNASITGIDSNTGNDNNAGITVITNIATNTRIANNAGYAGIASIPNRGDTPWQQQSTVPRSRASSP